MIGRGFKVSYIILLFMTTSLLALTTQRTVVPDDKPYFKQNIKDAGITLIYTQKNLSFAQHAAGIEKNLNEDYRNFFQWYLDETLYVGLISDKNEIANGFSTQWPNNRQINYIGGSSEVDYFCNTSWLDLLLYHETAHNYQVNAKSSIVSRTLHAIFGNGTLFLPTYFTVPGSAANSFMLEGNAVLNESWHGSGGRLYSGRFRAMTLLQAKAGNIKPNYMYNKRLEFPYSGDIYYHIGGFYNLYMAQKYGLEKINSYFLKKTQDWWWPFRTNVSMKRAVDVTFEESLEDFSKLYANMAEGLVLAKGKHIASSQFYTQLSSDVNEIFFLNNETGYKRPELVVINKKDASVQKKRGSWMASKVIKKDAVYYTQGSNHTSTTKITQGLYDSDGFIKKGTESKMIQGYLNDGRAVYFDVASSYKSPQLYVGKEYYGSVNSSVFIDKDGNLYYFKHTDKGKKRTLYKNREALYSYNGFYGIVADVDSQGAVYFIANSKLGSTLYRDKDGSVTRASSADNILEAKLLNDTKMLVSAVSEKDYYYVFNDVETIEQEPYEVKLFFEKKPYYGAYGESQNYILDTSKKYKAYSNMHYSGSDMDFSFLNGNSILGRLNINFADPLTQNSLTVFISRDELNTTIAGVAYKNSEHILEYGIRAYKVLQKSKIIKSRDNGFMASLSLPLYQAGYYNVLSSLTYFQDYDTLIREPLSISIALSREESYGISMYKNYQNSLNVYDVKEREESIYGFYYSFMHELGSQIYVKMEAQFSKTDTQISQEIANTEARGVKITPFSYQKDMDVSSVIMPSVTGNIYIKSIGFGEFALSKVFNFSSYFFTFPLSLQRESLYAKYRHYNIETFLNTRANEQVNEYLLGLRLDTVLLNTFAPLSLSFDFYYNDNKNFSQDRAKFLFSLSGTF